MSRVIADCIDSKDGISEVYIAPFAVFLNNDNTMDTLEPHSMNGCEFLIVMGENRLN